MEAKREIIESLTMEDFRGHGQMEEIAEVQGVEFARRLIQDHESMNLYVTPLGAFKSALHRYILNNKHLPIQVLIKKTGKTRRYIRRVIEKNK
ncbi:MAG: hypothetical protein ACLFQX_04005 [Candidatus Kapaibacterium sp.]